MPTAYRGRFAPTPSGPLHAGSLLTAVASYLDARHHDGEWLVRVEDIDLPRCPSGAADTILRQLEAFGLEWDTDTPDMTRDVRYQSHRNDAYATALEQLKANCAVYPCDCSRKQWRGFSLYPGWCRTRSTPPCGAHAWRLDIRAAEQWGGNAAVAGWEDRLQGHVQLDLATLGDVVLKRRDSLWAYQLAVVVDDADQGITDVVRGLDLLDNSPWQRLLQAALGLPMPSLTHLPLITADNGQKLSKQNLAPALPEAPDAIRQRLHHTLKLLGQHPPNELVDASPAEQLAHAIPRWSLAAVGKATALSASAPS
ncbi:tRNA glutamyl-Q(34) synthetase GluQRS [Cobetia crustatorum]|uniref:Glutamyl-Q tRNA(Asp) synthetase n=1 Tax=Cobetia crustatorum TaxID=553385 RepID=A0A558HSH7_9GAMM|nr:tRNA glutamyl-Q(34) synthetase GluQRS [Cobetia crustatorum]TVU72095.1 tRNA glutamyl-Q(34) synthetase GluQRS [Cobetia crustatorum]